MSLTVITIMYYTYILYYSISIAAFTGHPNPDLKLCVNAAYDIPPSTYKSMT